jgi:hypothetical protein
MGMIEPVPAPEIFCSGLGEVEDIGGGCLRFYLYVMQTPVEVEGPPQKVVVARIIAPASAVPEAVSKMLQAVGRKAGAAVLSLVP